ncbi:HNH endonuclease [Sphingomonas bisphenolicum]|uniref:HNH nuclease domain-containing protein n=1 Tax=Sphingomonas bisphenolicum TaxID=296544 RepID=A0ABM7G5G3_9SPHN|nr:HNH endonuclease signature motif containing protein [Sphingomonas bisphenolicum]BBF70271.1 hypothetical protein SBA_ch1_24710 [Sphingomonas bisphenolicum]
MRFVRNIGDIEQNAFTLLDEIYADGPSRDEAIELIKGGRVFYPIQYDDILAFVPSKFIGYRNNSVDEHQEIKNEDDRDGRETNLVIKRILGTPVHDRDVEQRLESYCLSLGVLLNKHKHSFWRIDTVKRFVAPASSAINDIVQNEIGNSDPEYRERMAGQYVRDPKVRAAVLRRADGVCEACGQPGFLKPDGSRYLEGHHVIKLSEQGPDQPHNVIALCANDHRRAHFGADWKEANDSFLDIIQKYRAAN